jgi:hypothetical protein
MATRRTALLTSSLVAALLSTSGCIDRDRPARTESAQEIARAPSPTADAAREEFRQALQRTQRASFRYTVRGELSDKGSVQGTGAFDPKGSALNRAGGLTRRCRTGSAAGRWCCRSSSW